MRSGSFLILLVLAFPGCQNPPRPVPKEVSLILHGGRIWTGGGPEPWAEAVAIEGDRIKLVGTSEWVLRHRGAMTEMIDLGGRLVVPGLVDSHVHFLEGGAEILAPELRSARSARELGERLGAWARNEGAGVWLTAGSWDHESWPGTALPTRQDLDAFTPANPVFVARLDGHMAVANSAALRAAGITRETPDPPGGVIVRDAAGEPAGVLKDSAMDLVNRHVPAPSRQQLLARARAALAHAASLGVTGVHDMGTSAEALEVYRSLRDAGELTLRLSVYLPIAAQTPAAARALRASHDDGRLLRVNGVKAYADGSLGSSTALFREPYADQPGTRGLALADASAGGPLEAQVLSYCEELFQPAIHAIGDEANAAILDLFRRVDRAASHPFHPPYREFRIEHAQHLAAEDIGRFGRYGVVASVQPYHAIDDGRWCEKRIGPDRSRRTYAFRSLLDQGATLAFGSDWPVAPLSPMLGVYAAVTRRTLDGKHPDGWIPDQKVTVEEALAAYTRGGARAGMAPKEQGLGAIAAGALADLVVLDGDVFRIDPVRIGEVQADLTIVDGRVVFERKR